MRKHVSGREIFAFAVIGAAVLAAVVGPTFLPYDPIAVSTSDRLLPPGSILPNGSLAVLGTDELGRDLLAQIFQGARVSLIVGIATLAIAGIVGCALGIIAGFGSRFVDAVIMRLADVQLAFPSILLAILVATVLGPSVQNVVITLALTRWVTFARVARATTLATRNREYVDAARVLGAGRWHLITRSIVPACISPVLVVATVELGQVIIAEASLSFLGLGTPATSPSWGLIIANGRDYLANGWWISTMPGIALALLVLAVGMLGDQMRDRLDPRMAGVLGRRGARYWRRVADVETLGVPTR